MLMAAAAVQPLSALFPVETGSLGSAAPLLGVEHRVCCIPELPPTCVHFMTDMEHVINSFKHVWM